MQICFTSDLHGSPALYAELDRLLETERPDLLLLGGDLFVDGAIDDPLGTQVAYVEREFLPRIAGWRARHRGLQVASILGNHDWLCTLAALRGHDELVLLSTGAPWSCNGVRFLGHSLTPPTPFWLKDFERLDLAADATPLESGVVWDSEQRRARQVQAIEHYGRHPALEQELAGAPRVQGPWIFVSHAPPFGTRLDRLPHLPQPIGSRAVRDWIASRQPLCSLHGHIHESPEVSGAFSDRIGETLCINPGQHPDRLHAVLFDVSQPERTLRHTVFS
jgi:Icc-related predicted phosphoesterase